MIKPPTNLLKNLPAWAKVIIALAIIGSSVYFSLHKSDGDKIEKIQNGNVISKSPNSTITIKVDSSKKSTVNNGDNINNNGNMINKSPNSSIKTH